MVGMIGAALAWGMLHWVTSNGRYVMAENGVPETKPDLS
jgi:hypothetical protein